MDERDINLRANQKKKSASSKGNLRKNSDASESSKSIEELAIEKCSSKEITLSDLVRELNEDLGYDTDRIIGKLMEMKEGNRIRIIEKRSLPDFGTIHCFTLFSLVLGSNFVYPNFICTNSCHVGCSDLSEVCIWWSSGAFPAGIFSSRVALRKEERAR